MSDRSHPDNGSQIDLAGYRSCANEWCGELVLLEVARRTGGHCSQCFTQVHAHVLTEIEVRHRGTRTMMQTRSKSQPKKNKGSRHTDRLVEHARRRAMKRLKTVFPDLYDIFLAEERARVGLDPWPVDMAVREGPDPDGTKTVDFATVYAHLNQAGVDVDGPPSRTNQQDPEDVPG